jgi:hypothetical protein
MKINTFFDETRASSMQRPNFPGMALFLIFFVID